MPNRLGEDEVICCKLRLEVKMNLHSTSLKSRMPKQRSDRCFCAAEVYQGGAVAERLYKQLLRELGLHPHLQLCSQYRSTRCFDHGPRTELLPTFIAQGLSRSRRKTAQIATFQTIQHDRVTGCDG